MNTYGVLVCGMSGSKCEVGMPYVFAKRRRAGVGPIIDNKGKAKVSSSNLTLTDLVGSGIEIFSKESKSSSSESSDHSNKFMVIS